MKYLNLVKNFSLFIKDNHLEFIFKNIFHEMVVVTFKKSKICKGIQNDFDILYAKIVYMPPKKKFEKLK